MAVALLGTFAIVAPASAQEESLNAAGIPAAAVTGETLTPEREERLRQLRERELNVLFTVDLFNEGVDVPQIDTVLFLRPTESSTIFLQQLAWLPPPPFHPGLRPTGRERARSLAR
mgnify:CR=1 FL=1